MAQPCIPKAVEGVVFATMMQFASGGQIPGLAWLGIMLVAGFKRPLTAVAQGGLSMFTRAKNTASAAWSKLPSFRSPSSS